jgi:hypothetical protein
LFGDSGHAHAVAGAFALGEISVRAEIEGEGAAKASVDELGPPIEAPPEVAFQHGIPVGLPGERIVEQGVIDDRLEDLLNPIAPRKRTTERGASQGLALSRGGAARRRAAPVADEVYLPIIDLALSGVIAVVGTVTVVGTLSAQSSRIAFAISIACGPPVG